jgi:hypothetical protein
VYFYIFDHFLYLGLMKLSIIYKNGKDQVGVRKTTGKIITGKIIIGKIITGKMVLSVVDSNKMAFLPRLNGSQLAWELATL